MCLVQGKADRRTRRLRGIRIIHEDEDVIVIEKAAGLLAQETRRGGEYAVDAALSDYVRKGQAKSPDFATLFFQKSHLSQCSRGSRETSAIIYVPTLQNTLTFALRADMPPFV